jgi:aminopeptidase YwaD
MRQIAMCCLGFALAASVVSAAELPLPDKDVAALARTVDGEAAKQTLEGIVQQRRERGGKGFHFAAEWVASRARSYGLEQVEILRFPADGVIFYGTQRSRPAWDAERAELAEVSGDREALLASYAAETMVLAEDSESADVTAALVDVGTGGKVADYEGKDVKGKLVLVSESPGAAQDLAVGRFGAVGILSYQGNNANGWSGDDLEQIRWGHLDTFSAHPTFAFMLSLRQANALKARLAAGESIRLHASVKAGQHVAPYEVVTATIRGADARLKEQEIAFTCHLDHPKPGANDNASGCSTTLEVGRTLQKLIADGTLARPARTIRFIWGPELEGTTALLNARPEFARRIKAVVHMDMVGGNARTQSIFHVTRGPASLPSFVHDVAWAFANWVNEQSYDFAATGRSEFPMLAPSGGKEPLRAEDSPFSMGSDHEVYQDSSFRIPAVYFNDWPDRYIHTTLDRADNIDPTKLGRVAFLGAATGLALANDARIGTPAAIGAPYFGPGPVSTGEGKLVFRRKPTPRGAMHGFNYDWFEDHAAKAGLPRPKLLDFESRLGDGSAYAYEVLNFADGRHDAQEITNAVSAEFGPVPLGVVLEYLHAQARIGVVERLRE